MPKPSRLNRAAEQIGSEFLAHPHRAYRASDIARVLFINKHRWDLPESTSVSQFTGFLLKQKILKAYTLRADAYEREVVRYALPGISPLILALSISSRAYLCHATALRLHNLAIGPQNPVYVNIEQSQKPVIAIPPTQEGIDRAFAGTQRRSNMLYKTGRSTIVQLAGKHTDRLGVEKLGQSDEYDVTNVERTLIDIVVRPAYAGGSEAIRMAYSRAKRKVSIDRLIATYKSLGYVYPYHQTIGFLMEITGYPTASYEKFRSMGVEYDFYLEHGLEAPDYSSEWRLYYPRGFLGS